MAHAQREFAEFVIGRIFNLVMRAKQDGRSEPDRRTLEHVQRETEAEIQRYCGYGSAQEVATNFTRDLSSAAANITPR